MPNDPLLLSWDTHDPLPRLALRPSERMKRQPRPALSEQIRTGPPDEPFDFSRAMRELCVDIAAKCPTFDHLDPSLMLFTIIKARNGQKHGLQARVTPLRCRGGSLTTRRGRRVYQVQRLMVDGREMRYLVTFCLPRFMNRTFAQKLVTVFHELYHVGPAFDGDLRYFEGRYATHTSDQKVYDAHVADLAEQYWRNGADRHACGFLEASFWQLCQRHGTIVGDHVPRPKLIFLRGDEKQS